MRTQALPEPSEKDAETKPIINESTAATTNTFSSVNPSGKATKSRKLPHSLNKSTAATAQNGKTKINVKHDREFLTKKHISYSKRKTNANNEKPLEISLEQIFKTNHELVWFIFHKWRFKSEESLNNKEARIFKANHELIWLIFHKWRFKTKVKTIKRVNCFI